eukprot:CAMPEP_0201687414 /NCGR_PEP_ID=MMETSP0578-20130828/1494_1 /ASSEMBLY_ACC=CAM_ASM_000663 /TAXON_ID=267565 /ORGANISM="Skeletonema grethea, Strain CCMP 1804" /LENGTH=384 /DNA_ID=CAMNT_0048171571 /DNA_START=1 /DNA_END=1155 /DNA_ORIENTATION=-
MIIMSPIDAAAAAFGYIQHSQQNSKQNSNVTIDDENVCLNKVESTHEDSCATCILLKRFASFLGSIIREYGLAETFLQPISDIRVTARILAEMLTSVITSNAQSLVPDVAEDISLDSSMYTLSEPKTPVATQPLSGGGLALLSSELLLEENDNERLDYSISQLDVLRMSRAASRRLRVDSIDQLPTAIYHEEQSEATGHQEEHDESTNQHEERSALICSSHEEFEEEIPATVVDGTKEIALKHTLQQGNRPEFSWLIVPEDPLQDDLTRISQHDEHMKSVPETISICSSHHSEENVRDAFDHCVICQESFQEGENLRVLPCGHLFHYRCIDGIQMTGDTLADDTGCPMCKEDIEQQTGESYHSDGSVPSWSFKRLGSLLASMGK